MDTRVAFLRGINVGGNKKVGMADLRAFAAEIGLQDPKTLLQSGNLVFGTQGKSDAELEKLLEVETEKRLSVSADYHVRSLDELEAVVEKNPFAKEAVEDPSHLVVSFYKLELATDCCEALRSAIKGREQFREAGREAYLHYPDNIGDSKLTNNILDSRLKQRGTARNWNTILKLVEMMKAR